MRLSLLILDSEEDKTSDSGKEDDKLIMHISIPKSVFSCFQIFQLQQRLVSSV